MSRLLLIFKRNKTMFETKIWSVEEMVHEDEFTDRVELLRELDQWIKAIERRGSTSTALIAPRQIGKTVLLDRLVNSVFFKPEYQVTPFYFKMTREKKNFKKVSIGIRHHLFQTISGLL
jgi:predicted AAA+ superfamily ATPase